MGKNEALAGSNTGYPPLTEIRENDENKYPAVIICHIDSMTKDTYYIQVHFVYSVLIIFLHFYHDHVCHGLNVFPNGCTQHLLIVILCCHPPHL